VPNRQTLPGSSAERILRHINPLCQAPGRQAPCRAIPRRTVKTGSSRPRCSHSPKCRRQWFRPWPRLASHTVDLGGHLDRPGGIRFAVGRGVGMEHGGEVGRRLRSGDHCQGVPARLGKQRQSRQGSRGCRGSAPAGRCGSCGSWRPPGPGCIERELGTAIAGMAFEQTVGGRVTESVEFDAVDGVCRVLSQY
jgi:hypothetical protein